MKAFGWSLYEIDRTDIESLLPFVMHVPAGNNHRVPMSTSDTETQSVVQRTNQVFCDQVSWL